MINEHQKWPTNKRKYDQEYLRVFGQVCPKCNGNTMGKDELGLPDPELVCNKCNGLGYVEKDKKK
jgi:DnaJ-class molecular chaperone